MVIKIIAPRGDKEVLLLEMITHEGMVSQMCLIVSFINEYIFYMSQTAKNGKSFIMLVSFIGLAHRYL